MEQLNGTETIVDNSLKEVKRHGSEGFPMGVYLDDFSHFQNGYICWHWHNEVQFTLIIKGEFTCQVGSEKLLLSPGDSIFINSCALHQIVPCKKSYGKLYSFIWKADMLAGNMECDLYHSCIENILNDSRKYYIYNKNNKNRAKMNAALIRIAGLFSEKPEDLLSAGWNLDGFV
ncbi:MAG: cupin domain-containing protein [Eubacteriales bacterium]|nr:cupin domain-containing protein [Eubacteriales bacterium]